MGLDNPLHILFIVLILLLVFGARRLPEIGRSLGTGMREFKQSITGEDHHQTQAAPPLAAAAPAPQQPVAAPAPPPAAEPAAPPSEPAPAAAPTQPAQAPATPGPDSASAPSEASPAAPQR